MTQAALVIGGGIAGMQAALDIANAGFPVILVEKSATIGGHMLQYSEVFPTLDCPQCIGTPKMVEVGSHPNIELMAYSEVEAITGRAGDFHVRIKKKPRYIDEAIKRMQQDVGATALRSVHEMSESTYKTFEINEDYLNCVCTGSWDVEAAGRPRQEYKKTYEGNGYVDIIRSSYALENRKIYGDRVIAFVTPRVFETDTPEDFDYLEYQVTKNPMLVKRLFG